MTAGVATGTALILGALPASAHVCFKTNLNEQAQRGQAGSANWVPFGTLAAEITGLCPAGVALLADAAAVSLNTMINTHGTMAGGTLKKGENAGTKTISHLDFEAIDAAFPDAAAACAG